VSPLGLQPVHYGQDAQAPVLLAAWMLHANGAASTRPVTCDLPALVAGHEDARALGGTGTVAAPRPEPATPTAGGPSAVCCTVGASVTRLITGPRRTTPASFRLGTRALGARRVRAHGVGHGRPVRPRWTSLVQRGFKIPLGGGQVGMAQHPLHVVQGHLRVTSQPVAAVWRRSCSDQFDPKASLARLNISRAAS